MKKHFLLISIAIIVLSCTKNLSVMVEYDESIPQVQFAVKEIEKSGTAAGLKFTTSNPNARRSVFRYDELEASLLTCN